MGCAGATEAPRLGEGGVSGLLRFIRSIIGAAFVWWSCVLLISAQVTKETQFAPIAILALLVTCQLMLGIVILLGDDDK